VSQAGVAQFAHPAAPDSVCLHEWVDRRQHRTSFGNVAASPRVVVVQDRGESLDQQIVRFSCAVFDAIGTSYPMLRNAGQERLWLIYFKGLLIANARRHEEMVQALREG
jgi:hypothetical protein